MLRVLGLVRCWCCCEFVLFGLVCCFGFWLVFCGVAVVFLVVLGGFCVNCWFLGR